MIAQYTILKKGEDILGIERGTFESGNKIEKLEKQGYIDLDISLSAHSEEHAVKEYINGDVGYNDIGSVSDSPKISTSTSKYGTARIVSSILQIFGWLTVIASLILFIVSMNDGLISIFTTIGSAVSGLFLIGLAQVILAIVDIADDISQLLKLERERQSHL